MVGQKVLQGKIMTNVVLLDLDGVVIEREIYFSQRFSNDFGVPLEKIIPFFKNEFQLCLAGKSDLKEELGKRLKDWGWNKSLDELLQYWFEHESNVDKRVLESVLKLRDAGTMVYLATNNEKYRVNYILYDLGLKDYFDGVFASCDLGVKKPENDFWERIYRQLGDIEKSSIVLFDDDIENIDSAVEFGFRAKLYTDFECYERVINKLA
jgi:putative hydrolase of the HAD superfamily